MKFPGTSGALPMLGLSLTLIFAGCSGAPGERQSASDERAASERTPAAPGGFVPDTKPAPPVRWGDATVPAATAIVVVLEDPLSSGTNVAGDRFQTRLRDAVMIGDQVVVPSGSTLHGVVAEARPAKRGFKDKGGVLLLAFERITTPNGASAPVEARLSEVGKGSAGRNAAIIAGGALGGAVLSKILGKEIEQGVVAGAAIGTAIAAGSPGREAVLAKETPLTVTLEKPLHIKVQQ